MNEEIKTCFICQNRTFSFHLTVKDHFLTGEDFNLVKCTGCGFIFVNPRPDAASIGGYYKSEAYISHDATRKDVVSILYKIARDFSIRRKFKLVKSYSEAGTILDYGCGTGEFLAYCRDHGFKATGIEPNSKARAFCIEQNSIDVHEKIDELIHQTGKFNVVTLWHVLEHIHELNETIVKLDKLLAPNGTLIIAVPNSTSYDARHYGAFWAAYDVPRHIYHFTKPTIGELFKKHNYYVEKVLPQKLDAYYVSMLSEKYMNGTNNYLKAVYKGFISNFNAGKTNQGYSSQIYILKRENP